MLKLEMTPSVMLSPARRCTIWYPDVDAPDPEHPLALPHHLGRVHGCIISAHQSINGRFIDNKVKGVARVGRHVSHVHHVPTEGRPGRMVTCWHLADDLLRDVIVKNLGKALIVQVLGQSRVPTAKVQNLDLRSPILLGLIYLWQLGKHR